MFAVTISSESLARLVEKAIDQCPAILMALASLVIAFRAKREAREAARKQIHFALADAVHSGALSAPDSSPLRSSDLSQEVLESVTTA